MTLRDAIEPPFSALRRTPPLCFGRTMKAIDLVCLDGSAARRGTAPALQSVIGEQRRP